MSPKPDKPEGLFGRLKKQYRKSSTDNVTGMYGQLQPSQGANQRPALAPHAEESQPVNPNMSSQVEHPESSFTGSSFDQADAGHIMGYNPEQQDPDASKTGINGYPADIDTSSGANPDVTHTPVASLDPGAAQSREIESHNHEADEELRQAMLMSLAAADEEKRRKEEEEQELQRALEASKIADDEYQEQLRQAIALSEQEYKRSDPGSDLTEGLKLSQEDIENRLHQGRISSSEYFAYLAGLKPHNHEDTSRDAVEPETTVAMTDASENDAAVESHGPHRSGTLSSTIHAEDDLDIPVGTLIDDESVVAQPSDQSRSSQDVSDSIFAEATQPLRISKLNTPATSPEANGHVEAEFGSSLSSNLARQATIDSLGLTPDDLAAGGYDGDYDPQLGIANAGSEELFNPPESSVGRDVDQASLHEAPGFYYRTESPVFSSRAQSPQDMSPSDSVGAVSSSGPDARDETLQRSGSHNSVSQIHDSVSQTGALQPSSTLQPSVPSVRIPAVFSRLPEDAQSVRNVSHVNSQTSSTTNTLLSVPTSPSKLSEYDEDRFVDVSPLFAPSFDANALANESVLRSVSYGFVTSPYVDSSEKFKTLSHSGQLPNWIAAPVDQFFAVQAESWRQLLVFLMWHGNSQLVSSGNVASVRPVLSLVSNMNLSTIVRVVFLPADNRTSPQTHNHVGPGPGELHVFVDFPKPHIALPATSATFASNLFNAHTAARRGVTGEFPCPPALMVLPSAIDCVSEILGDTPSADSRAIEEDERSVLSRMRSKLLFKKRAPGVVRGGADGTHGRPIAASQALPDEALLVTPFKLR